MDTPSSYYRRFRSLLEFKKRNRRLETAEHICETTVKI